MGWCHCMGNVPPQCMSYLASLSAEDQQRLSMLMEKLPMAKAGFPDSDIVFLLTIIKCMDVERIFIREKVITQLRLHSAHADEQLMNALNIDDSDLY